MNTLHEPHPTIPNHNTPHHTTPHHITPHHTTSHHITPHHITSHHTTHTGCWVQKNLNRGPIYQTPQNDIDEPAGPLVASNQKVTLKQKLMFLGHLKALFYTRPPNSQLLSSKPGNAPLVRDFDKPAGPPGCVKSKRYIKPKVNDSGSPTSFV